MDASVPAVSLMAGVVCSGDGSVAVLCICVFPAYTECVVKSPVTKFCTPSTVCLGWHVKTNPRCTEYPGPELLSLSLQISLWKGPLWRHSVKELLVTLSTPRDTDLSGVVLLVSVVPSGPGQPLLLHFPIEPSPSSHRCNLLPHTVWLLHCLFPLMEWLLFHFRKWVASLWRDFFFAANVTTDGSTASLRNLHWMYSTKCRERGLFHEYVVLCDSYSDQKDGTHVFAYFF